jgi:hypothetical protein
LVITQIISVRRTFGGQLEEQGRFVWKRRLVEIIFLISVFYKQKRHAVSPACNSSSISSS